MKKTALTLAIVIGLAIGGFAQNKGLFDMGPDDFETTDYSTRGEGGLILPQSHGEEGDQSAPLGTGTLMLIGFGAAYALKTRRKNQLPY